MQVVNALKKKALFKGMDELKKVLVIFGSLSPSYAQTALIAFCLI